MLKRDAPSVEADGCVGVAARIAVFQVAANGTANVRQLATNLMMPTRKQLDFKQIKSFRFPNHAITQPCQFGVFCAFGNDERLVHLLVLDDKVL